MALLKVEQKDLESLLERQWKIRDCTCEVEEWDFVEIPFPQCFVFTLLLWSKLSSL